MSETRANGELRLQIELQPPELELQIQDPIKNDTDRESTDFNHPSEEMITHVPLQGTLHESQDSPSQQSNVQSQSVTESSQFVNLPLDPPPYSELPIYTIPVTIRECTIFDPPPPYDPTMRREVFDPLDFPYQNYQQNRSSRFECKPDTLVPLGFCYCTLEQLIVTLAILGTFLFLGLGQIN